MKLVLRFTMLFILCAVCAFSIAQSQFPNIRTSQAVSYSSSPGTSFYSSTGGSSRSIFDSGPQSTSQSVSNSGLGGTSVIANSGSQGASHSVSYSSVPGTFSTTGSSSQSILDSGPGSASQFVTYPEPDEAIQLFSYSGSTSAEDGGTSISSLPPLPPLPPISFHHHPLFPHLTNNYVSIFAHSFFRLVKASPVLNQPNDFVIDDAVIYRVAKIILERDGVLDPSLAQLAAEAGRKTGVVTYDLYLKALSLMFAKVLYLNGILTQEIATTYPELSLRFIEEYARKHGVSDIESVLRAVTNGTVDFAVSKGFSTISNLILSFQLFVQEITALANGAEF